MPSGLLIPEESAVDADCFDAVIRGLANDATRRHAVGGMLGVGLAALTAGGSRENTVAKKRRKRKKKKSLECAGKVCTGACIDVKTDPANCGACGVACGLASCVNGACVCQGVNKASCDEVCVDLAVDSANCGACDNTCIVTSCIHGACDCAGAQANCPAGCTCAARKEGGTVCIVGVNPAANCATDVDCQIGAACLVNDRCSTPCVA